MPAMLLFLVNIVTIHSLANQRWSPECFHWPSHRLLYVETLPTLGVTETGGWFGGPCMPKLMINNYYNRYQIKLPGALVTCTVDEMGKKSKKSLYSILTPFCTHTHTHTHSAIWYGL